jgi:hypothetical protein
VGGSMHDCRKAEEIYKYLDNMANKICMLNNGSNEILEVGKMSRDMKGIWFENNNMIKENKTTPKKVVPPKKKIECQMSDHKS